MHGSKTILRGCFTSALSARPVRKGWLCEHHRRTETPVLPHPRGSPLFPFPPARSSPVHPDESRCAARGPAANVKRGIVCEILIPLGLHPLDVTEKYEPTSRRFLTVELLYPVGCRIIAFIISSVALYAKVLCNEFFKRRLVGRRCFSWLGLRVKGVSEETQAIDSRGLVVGIFDSYYYLDVLLRFGSFCYSLEFLGVAILSF